MRRGGNVGRAVVKSGHAVLFAQLGKLINLDLTLRIVGVVEEHHGGPLVDSRLQLFAGFDFHEAHAAVAHRLVVPVTM